MFSGTDFVYKLMYRLADKCLPNSITLTPQEESQKWTVTMSFLTLAFEGSREVKTKDVSFTSKDVNLSLVKMSMIFLADKLSSSFHTVKAIMPKASF